MTLSSTVATGAIGLFLGQLGEVPGVKAQVWLILLALGSQVVGWLLITWALTRIAAAVTALVLTLQPAGSVVLAMIILGEKAFSAAAARSLCDRRCNPAGNDPLRHQVERRRREPRSALKRSAGEGETLNESRCSSATPT